MSVEIYSYVHMKRFLIVMHFDRTLRERELAGFINTCLDKVGAGDRSMYVDGSKMLITFSSDDENRVTSELQVVEAHFGVGAFDVHELKIKD